MNFVDVFRILREQIPRIMPTYPQISFPATVALTATLLLSCGSRNNGADPRPVGRSSGMTVNGVVAVPQPLDNIVRSSGTVLASESVDLVAESAGRIDSILFREGSHVRKNDLLVQIDDADLRAQLRKTELQIQLAADQESRQRQLYEKSAISKEQFEISSNQVNTLRADRDNLLAAIRKRAIRAPFDGVIGLRYVSVGGFVSQTTRVASIQKINPLKIDFAIPQKYAGDVTVGETVLCSSEEPKIEFTGKVYAVEPKIDPTLGTLQLRALCENRSEKIFPGAFVHIELHLKTITDALLVPTQAIIPVLKGQTILVKRNGVVVSVPVRTGMRTATSVQVVEGLAAGDTVITSGLMQLRPGMPVQVTIQ